MGNKILITGGTGFIASYLVMKLLEDDPTTEVVLFDRDPDMRRLTGFKQRYDAVKERITFVQGDLSLLPHVLAVFDVNEPAAVYHLGALLSAGAESNPTQGFQVDTIGTWNVLEAARLYYHRHCDKLQNPIKVVFPSTIASFGSFIAAGLKVENEDIQMPTTMYGLSKVTSERLGEYYNRKKWVDFRAVRFPSVIGAARGPGGTTVYST
ncbi:MAG: NAD-dependent epimerase/dehydratase family protein, partial [Gammaproteobacteria bacterium]